MDAEASFALTVETESQRKRFQVALSFPGEHRNFVESVARALTENIGQGNVFYDKFYEAELGRPNLDTYLQQIYRDQSELVVIFVCAEYESKEWCGLEWRAIRDLLKRKQAHAIMPIRFDQTEIKGLLSIDGYVSVGNRTPEQIADLIAMRLHDNKGRTAQP